jgi:hypothetical protein
MREEKLEHDKCVGSRDGVVDLLKIVAGLLLRAVRDLLEVLCGKERLKRRITTNAEDFARARSIA